MLQQVHLDGRLEDLTVNTNNFKCGKIRIYFIDICSVKKDDYNFKLQINTISQMFTIEFHFKVRQIFQQFYDLIRLREVYFQTLSKQTDIQLQPPRGFLTQQLDQKHIQSGYYESSGLILDLGQQQDFVRKILKPGETLNLSKSVKLYDLEQNDMQNSTSKSTALSKS